jgi:subtilisin-like proprotein convertase family protein/uncharacterized protein YvpB
MIGLTFILLSSSRVMPAAAGSSIIQNDRSSFTEEAEPPPDVPEAASLSDTVQSIFLPVAYQQLNGDPVEYIPSQSLLVCSSDSHPVPDLSSASSTITIDDPRFIADLDIRLNIEHTWVGDLVVSLSHIDTGQTISLVDRPGYPDKQRGCGGDDITAILDDEMSSRVENKCSGYPAISGIYIPEAPLSAFDRQSISGSWALSVSDLDQGDQGRLKDWCLFARVSPQPAPDVPPPAPGDLPAQARVHGISGQHQALPLDCESRSAVDWAGFFGYQINELQFHKQLEKSDNPDVGFVGDVYGTWGQTPPNDYGVHAGPVANLLRAYGVSAYAHRPLYWDQLRAEIAAGRPVFVWVVGSVYNGVPKYYTPSDGLHTVVAPREHTVIVIGYSSTEVTILDGASTYTRSINQFLDSWSALGNMAITINP